ncbi:MAG: hypothetical protein ABSB50_03885 [Terracidiphilus sp.]|jgi:hypothetical protein
MPLNHFNILHESNSPRIVEILLKWCDVQPDESHAQLAAARD